MLKIDLFWSTITIFSVIIEWIVLKVILNEFSILKISKLKSNTLLLISMSIIIILTLKNLNTNIKVFIGIAMIYIFCIYSYEVDKIKGLFISLFYCMMLIGFDAISSSVLIKLNGISNINKLLESNVFRLELIFLSKSLLLLLIPIVKSSKIKVGIKKKDCVYLTIPIIANIISIVFTFTYIFKEANIDSIESTEIFIVSFILLISNISLVGIVCRIIKDNNLKRDNKIITEKINIQYKYYSMLQESYSRTKKLYHDMNNHMICMQNIYGSNEIADKYFEDINKELKDCKILFNTSNVILDVILNEKYITCKKNNIEFTSDINFEKCNFIDMPDICSIFSNMLDNSIEACSKININDIEKKIKLRGTIVNRFFVIKCENTRVNDIDFDEDRILTDKEDEFLHGIGISSIKKSVEKYNGNVEIDSLQNKFKMTIYIPLI